MTAAITKAPDISTTIFILYINNFEAFINSYSVINITYYTFPFRTSKFISPKLTLTPSANVFGGNWGWRIPVYNESFASPARYGCTPITLVFGLNLSVERTVPPDNPPPPIGTKI